MASGKTVSSEDEELLGDRPRPREASFLQALMSAFGPTFLLSMSFMLVQDLLSFVNPQLLRSHHTPPCCGPAQRRTADKDGFESRALNSSYSALSTR